MCLLNTVFHEGKQLGEHEVFVLSHIAKQELLLLTAFAPYMQTDLRARPAPCLFATDASLHGAGVVKAQIGAAASLELWRVADHKGFYTHKESFLGAYLKEFGEELAAPTTASSLPQSLAEGFLWDFAEVFKGHGNFSAAFRFAGFRVHDGYEVTRDPFSQNVLVPSTILFLVGLISDEWFVYFILAHRTPLLVL